MSTPKTKLTITQKPVKVSSGKSRDSYLIHLSDGTTTGLTGAARIAGISTKGMLKRINKDWRDKDIFGPWRRSGGAQKADLARLERGKFAWMKNDSRDYRLSRIPAPSRFEMGL